MKTTLDIADSILLRAKELAHKQQLTLRSLVEEGLELALEKRTQAKPYKCNPVTFNGKGLSEEFQGADWEKIRDASYKGRGG